MIPTFLFRPAKTEAKLKEEGKDSTLTFTDITVSVGHGVNSHLDLKCGSNEKQILRKVSGSVRGGRMMAIMGGSGAGKTTLLDVLALRAAKFGKVEGSISLNGVPLTSDRFYKSAAFVAQESKLWGTLTTRENLLYCAELYGFGTCKRERMLLVDKVLSETGLTSSENVRVGDCLRKGLSGGQKKRLCIAEALLKRPAVLMMDEPTSALDSTSAFEVIQLLQGMAKRERYLVLCTIHQPSHRVFSFFDDVLVLSAGRVAYAGPRHEAVSHMVGIGMPPLTEGISIPEYLLDLTNPDFTGEDHVNQILDAWQTRHAQEPIVDSVELHETIMQPVVKQTMILTRRLARMMMRDPTLYSARWVFSLVANFFFAIVYMDARDRIQAQVVPRVFLMSWCVGSPAFMSVVTIAVYSLDFHVYTKEIKNGMYCPGAYVLSQVAVMIPSLYLLSACSLLPLYSVVGFSVQNVFWIWLAHFAVMLWAECLAQLLAVCVPHYLMGMVAYIGVMFIAFLECGAIVNMHRVTQALSWIHHIDPWNLCLRAMTKLDFEESLFEVSDGNGGIIEVEGSIVLDTLNNTFSGFASDGTSLQLIATSIGIAIILKLVQYVILRIRR
eukprot:TRINITY_DN26991_c0_g2_i1.p1 TRINITY_DN26991_c0_g2~~TRINITY_DN26991_c0_g2_i1.p1  ORF type:complete len:609 (-),score=71.69 TRINITY_DN26991_c0_g2_i1:312-2138(-)